MDASMIAPCGINCALCFAHQRTKKHCGGCRSEDIPFESCKNCVIRNCEVRLQNNWADCSLCQRQCARLKQLEKRYRTKYSVNLFENLEFISGKGTDAFLEQQAVQYTYAKCGGLICMHKAKCLKCE